MSKDKYVQLKELMETDYSGFLDFAEKVDPNSLDYKALLGLLKPEKSKFFFTLIFPYGFCNNVWHGTGVLLNRISSDELDYQHLRQLLVTVTFYQKSRVQIILMEKFPKELSVEDLREFLKSEISEVQDGARILLMKNFLHSLSNTDLEEFVKLGDSEVKKQAQGLIKDIKNYESSSEKVLKLFK